MPVSMRKLLTLAFALCFMAAFASAPDFYSTAEFLYWQPQEGGLDFAATTETDTSSHTRAHNFQFDYEPGIRLGIGHIVPHSLWDIFLQWTYVRVDESQARRSSGMTAKTVTATRIFDVSPLAHAHAHWSVILHQANLELGKVFPQSTWLDIRPHIGIATAWIDQSLRCSYDFLTTGTSTAEVKANNNFFGIGLRSGVQTTWHLGGDWSIIGSGAGALLWGHFNVRDNAMQGTTFLHSVSDQIHRLRTEVQLMLGFLWKHVVRDGRYVWNVRIGYEFNEWFGQNQLYKFSQGNNGGTLVRESNNLGFQGLNVGAQLDF